MDTRKHGAWPQIQSLNSELTHAGMKIVPIGVDRNGNINMEELKQKASDHKDE